MTENHCHCHHEDHDAAAPSNIYEQAFAKYDLHLHDEHVSEAVHRLVHDRWADYNTPEVKRTLLGTVELTTLKVTDSQESVLAFTERVNRFADEHPDLPHLATICVYPNFAKIVSESLEADEVEVACVAGGFPSSQTFLEIKTAETALAIHDGAIKEWIADDVACPIAKGSRVKMDKDLPVVRTIDTYYNDVDVNGHINSVKYIEHVLDLFPVEWYKEYALKRLEIAYVAESHAGDKLAFRMQDGADELEKLICISKVAENDSNTVEVCRTMVKFAKK